MYNLGTGHPQTVNRLVEVIGGEVVHVPKRPGEPDCTWANISKIKEQLSWKPTVPFEQGVRLMLDKIENIFARNHIVKPNNPTSAFPKRIIQYIAYVFCLES